MHRNEVSAGQKFSGELLRQHDHPMPIEYLAIDMVAACIKGSSDNIGNILVVATKALRHPIMCWRRATRIQRLTLGNGTLGRSWLMWLRSHVN